VSVEDIPSAHRDRYRLDQLGWLQFERLASLVLDAEAGLRELDWQDRAYRGRTAWVEGPVVLPGTGVRMPGPVAIAVAWVRDLPLASRLSRFVTRLLGALSEMELCEPLQLLVVTNLDEEAARQALSEQWFAASGRVAVLGASGLSESLDRHPAVRSAMPSVLGLRDLAPLIPEDVRARSSLDIARAQGLARVFVPTRAYGRARGVLARHRFVVLTGAPEMGKTAIAHMIALAQLTTGWEAHDCNSPEQVWEAFDRERAQVFVADDAFGSTEYRPDAAEHWARELGRLLKALDERHWLIWTSRPAPLRSGLRRVQRERGSERFPAPGEVLVDASDLDLAEKTLILFRHVKAHPPSGPARELVRASGHTIVEHPHFTPERIRRFVSKRLETLVRGVQHRPWPAGTAGRVRAAVDRELAAPTEQMATSFRALEDEHRSLLIALLDTPAGLADERELAATVRRHHPGGLTRPPHELIDRLTDHFLCKSSLGIDWVHPSWRDLVIDELRTHPDARRRFLRACGPYGALLTLSQAGGATGERALPLLVDDGDWDVFTDRVAELLHELEDGDLARLLLACRAALGIDLDAYQRAEARSLAEYALGATRRSWDKERRPLPVFLLEAWYEANSSLPEPLAPPKVGPTWVELHPASLALAGDDAELRRTDEWLALAQALARYDPQTLEALGFPERESATLARVIDAITQHHIRAPNRDLRSLAEQLLSRLWELAPDYAERLAGDETVAAPPPEDCWWVPEDIAAPPTTERVTPTAPLFTREDVDLVLKDL
jgi:hypothetical protein